ncbi:MAG: DNA mismatch repair endonuclease MutL [Lachnospiraceae bacterium]|nr:DNA mismatch repair endonuclease MutL [Lachnospiraceae bacterium]
MGIVHLLNSETVNQIAAGEVIERPASVVKELTENAVDSGADRVTIEISGGGVDSIRVTDNGSGFASDDIKTAFLRHATSKISCGEDLFRIHSLGFRGEALSSIAAVAKVELLTYNEQDYLGTRYVIEGGEEISYEEAGCPTGTTIIVRDLFYNVPARRKFVKSATTETGYCNEWLNRFAIAHPEVSVTLLCGGRTLLHTSGNGNLKDAIYAVYGREVATHLLPVSYEGIGLTVSGCIGDTSIERSNRSAELCFVNGRDIKSKLVQKAAEEAYRTYLMQHKYPFTALFLTVRPDIIDVNIHPTKSDVRFSDADEVSHAVFTAVRTALKETNLIRTSMLNRDPAAKEPVSKVRPAESFESVRIRMEEYGEPKNADAAFTQMSGPAEESEKADAFETPGAEIPVIAEIGNSDQPDGTSEAEEAFETTEDTESSVLPESYSVDASDDAGVSEDSAIDVYGEQMSFLKPEQERTRYEIVGCVFDTYWILELPNQMLMIDQHAAHERINYERLIAKLASDEVYTQQLTPPEVITLTIREEETLNANAEHFAKLGFEIRSLGGREYGVFGVPTVLLGISPRDYIAETLERLTENRGEGEPLLQVALKVASMSCKAAIKGGQKISRQEAEHLIRELMTLENPYHCPHGRPIIISLTKADIEKRFRRIV